MKLTATPGCKTAALPQCKSLCPIGASLGATTVVGDATQDECITHVIVSLMVTSQILLIRRLPKSFCRTATRSVGMQIGGDTQLRSRLNCVELKRTRALMRVQHCLMLWHPCLTSQVWFCSTVFLRTRGRLQATLLRHAERGRTYGYDTKRGDHGH